MSRKKSVELNDEEEINNTDEVENTDSEEETRQNDKKHHLLISHDLWKKLMIIKLQTDKEFDEIISEALED